MSMCRHVCTRRPGVVDAEGRRALELQPVRVVEGHKPEGKAAVVEKETVVVLDAAGRCWGLVGRATVELPTRGSEREGHELEGGRDGGVC